MRKRHKLRQAWDILLEVYAEWDRDNVSLLSAALAFYTIFSLAPLIIIAIALASFAFGREAARGEIVYQIRGLVGTEGARVIQALLAGSTKQSRLATALGLGTSVIGATVVFVALQEALNQIWNVIPKPEKVIKMFFKKRLVSFLMIMAVGLLLIASLIFSAAISFGENYFSNSFHLPPSLLQTINITASLAVFTFLFAMIYKVLPDVRIAWSDVWIGALITSVLFTAGKYLIGIYLGHSSFKSTYGAAGSFVLLLIWVYYSAQIFLLGGEFAQVYARRYGSGIVPNENALRVTRKIQKEK